MSLINETAVVGDILQQHIKQVLSENAKVLVVVKDGTDVAYSTNLNLDEYVRCSNIVEEGLEKEAIQEDTTKSLVKNLTKSIEL